MATSGIINYSPSGVVLGAKNYSLSWSRVDYSIENNTSTIQWTFAIETNVSDGGYSKYSYTININGNTYTGSLPDTLSKGSNDIRTETIVIPHNADGTKSFSYDFSCTRSSGKASASGTGTLDTIPRPATIVSATDFSDEANPSITYNNISGELVDELEACISFTGAADDVPYRAISKTGSSYTFELTNSERNTLRNAITTGNSTTVRFYVKTTIGDYVSYSFLTKTLTLVNYKPVLSPTIVDINPVTVALTGNADRLIRYYSNAEVTFYAVARKGATVVEKNLTNGSQIFSIIDANQDSVVVNGADGDTFYLSVTDSRGYTTQSTRELGENFIPYFRVTCNQTIELDRDGVITLTVKGNYFNGSFGAQNNALTIQVRQNEDGGEWSEWGDITPLVSEIGDGTYTLSSTVSGYDPSGTYGFQCRAIDKLSTAESAIDTIALKPVFDWSKKDFNFNVPVTIEGATINDFVVEYGTEDMGTNGTWYWSKWKSGKAECYGCRNFGNMAVTTAWGGLYRSGTFTQSLPSGLFTDTPEVIDISLRSTGNYGGWIARHEESSPSDYDTGSFIVVRPASATVMQAYIGFNIVGRWK